MQQQIIYHNPNIQISNLEVPVGMVDGILAKLRNPVNQDSWLTDSFGTSVNHPLFLSLGYAKTTYISEFHPHIPAGRIFQKKGHLQSGLLCGAALPGAFFPGKNRSLGFCNLKLCFLHSTKTIFNGTRLDRRGLKS